MRAAIVRDYHNVNEALACQFAGVSEAWYIYANQMCVCVDGIANLCCAIWEWFAYHSPQTKICRFLREHKG